MVGAVGAALAQPGCTWGCDGAAPVPRTCCRARPFPHSPWSRGKSSWGASPSSLHFLDTEVPRDGEACVCGDRRGKGGLSKFMDPSWDDPCDPLLHLLCIPHFFLLSSSDKHIPIWRKKRRGNTWGRKGLPGSKPISFPGEGCMQERVFTEIYALKTSLCLWSLLLGDPLRQWFQITLCLLSHSPTPLSGSLRASSPSRASTPACQGLVPAPSPDPSPQTPEFPCPDPVPGHLCVDLSPQRCRGCADEPLPVPACACAISSDRPQGIPAGSRNLFADTSGRSRGSVMLCRQFSLCYCFKLHVSRSCFPGFRVFQIIFPRGIDSIFPNWISFIFYPGFQSLWGPLYYFSVRTAVYNIS